MHLQAQHKTFYTMQFRLTKSQQTSSLTVLSAKPKIHQTHIQNTLINARKIQTKNERMNDLCWFCTCRSILYMYIYVCFLFFILLCSVSDIVRLERPSAFGEDHGFRLDCLLLCAVCITTINHSLLQFRRRSMVCVLPVSHSVGRRIVFVSL